MSFKINVFLKRAIKLCVFTYVLFNGISTTNVMAQNTPQDHIETAIHKKQKGLLKHQVSFKFKENITNSEVEAIVNVFIDLQHKIPEILDFEWGINNSKEGFSKGFTHNFVLTFKNTKTLAVYATHKEHLKFGAAVQPMLADLFVIDYYTK